MACHLLPHLSAVAIDVVLTRMIREGCRQLVEEIHFGGVQLVSELWGDGLLATFMRLLCERVAVCAPP